MDLKLYNDSEFFRNPTVAITSLDVTYVVLADFTSFCSILSSLAMISCYLLYIDLRTTARKLLVFLSIADFCLGVSGILQASTYFKSLTLFDEKSVLCQASSFLVVYSSICSFLWTDAISFYLFLSVGVRDISVGNKLVVFFHVFCWVMPAIVALSAAASDVYGYDMSFVLRSKRPTWCWITDRVENQSDWYYMTVEGWGMASLILSLIAFISITVSINRQLKKQRSMDRNETIEDMAIHTVNNQLRYVPAIFIALKIWGSIYFLMGKVGPSKILNITNSWLLIMKGLTEHSQGVANFILFVVSSKFLINRVKRWFRLHCNLCRIEHKYSLDGSFSAPKIFRVRGKYQKKSRARIEDMDISGISLDLPTSPEQSMMEDEVVFERD